MRRLSWIANKFLIRPIQVAGLPTPTAWFTQNGWASAVNSTADFFNSAQLSPFVRVTKNNGFLIMSLLTKRLHVQFVVVRQFSHW